jgi:hypothetical protein
MVESCSRSIPSKTLLRAAKTSSRHLGVSLFFQSESMETQTGEKIRHSPDNVTQVLFSFESLQ